MKKLKIFQIKVRKALRIMQNMPCWIRLILKKN